MDNQFLIKAVLLLSIGAVIFLIVWPGRSARRLALRRISLALIGVLAAIAVVVPDVSNSIAELFGVGRGADLLLYGLLIAFIVQVIASRVHYSKLEMQVTEVARALAVRGAEQPGSRES